MQDHSQEPLPEGSSPFPGDDLEELANLPLLTPSSLLPPALEIIPKLLALIQDPDVHNEQILNVIRMDTGLTADVLRVCNSAAFGGRCRTETIAEAVNHIGLREVYRIVLRVAASAWFLKVQEEGFDKLDLWQHSIYAALAGHILAGRSGEDPEVVYTASLLHDVGKLALWQEFGQEYTLLIEHARIVRRPVLDAERDRFGIDHAAVGGRLLSEWNLPETIAAAVAFHHEPGAGGKFSRIAGLVHASNVIAHATQNPQKEYFQIFAPRLLEAFRFLPGEFDEVEAEIHRRFIREKAVLAVR